MRPVKWGQRWTDGEGGGPRFVNRHSGAELQPLQFVDADGQTLGLRDVSMVLEPAPQRASSPHIS